MGERVLSLLMFTFQRGGSWGLKEDLSALSCWPEASVALKKIYRHVKRTEVGFTDILFSSKCSNKRKGRQGRSCSLWAIGEDQSLYFWISQVVREQRQGIETSEGSQSAVTIEAKTTGVKDRWAPSLKEKGSKK